MLIFSPNVELTIVCEDAGFWAGPGSGGFANVRVQREVRFHSQGLARAALDWGIGSTIFQTGEEGT